jgi:hypothetical protein
VSEPVSAAGKHADEPSSWSGGTRGEAVALVRAALEELSQPEPVGWRVLDPDGNVVATGGQTVMEAVSDAGEVTGETRGGD